MRRTVSITIKINGLLCERVSADEAEKGRSFGIHCGGKSKVKMSVSGSGGNFVTLGL